MSALPRTMAARVRRSREPDRAIGSDGLRRVDRLVEQAALVMVPSGLVLIILGWFGASRTPYTFEQIPYLISGGLFGVAVTVTGGLLYVGGWIARSAQATVPKVAAGTPGPAHDAPVAGNLAEAFVRTPSGTMFHRPDCSIVQGRDDVVELRPGEAVGYRPCGMCEPLA